MGSGRTSCSVHFHIQLWRLFSCICDTTPEKPHSIPSSFQYITNGFGLYLRISANFTSLCPRYTSSFTSSTEKPNRSSNSGVFLQQRPEAYNCQTGKTSGVSEAKYKMEGARKTEKQSINQSKLKKNVIRSLLLNYWCRFVRRLMLRGYKYLHLSNCRLFKVLSLKFHSMIVIHV